MADVDPVTGQPKVTVEKDVSEKYSHLVDQKGKADQLASELSSEKGQMVINTIQGHLLSRVNKLIDEDGECRALKRLLIDMGVTINMGEMAIAKLMQMLTRKGGK